MNKLQKIREEVEKRYEYWKEKEFNSHSVESEIRMSECQHLLSMIDSLQEEPVSEDFEEALANEWKGYNDRGAATFDALEDNTQELTFAKGFYRGAKWQKEQIMKDAIDVEVKMGTDGYPYIPQIEAYDYDKDAPFVKEGDKLKVIVIKEE